MRVFVPILATALLSACSGPIDPPPPTDEEGERIERPGPFDTWLEVASVSPAGDTISDRPVVRIELETWIDDDALVDFSTVSLHSAGLTVRGRTRWEMTTRTLVFEPFGGFVDGLRYTPRLDGGQLESVTGAPFRSSELKDWLVDASNEPPDIPEESAPTWDDVDELLQRKCRSCHADPEWKLNPLTHDSMVGERSAQDDRILVLPFDPGDSYLMHKILPDYPVRRFTVQPPPWSDAAPLTRQEQRMVELWINNGARRR